MSEGRVTVAELGVAVETVLSDAMGAGVTGYRGPFAPAQAEAIRAVRRERRARITQRALAAELGATVATVALRGRRLGFGGGSGYTAAQAAAIRRSFARGRR